MILSSATAKMLCIRFSLVVKGGLAWLLWQEGGVVNTVAVLGCSGVGLGV